MTGPHEHWITALWWNFGPYGRQDVHVHECLDRRCSTVVIGQGRDCKKGALHHEEKLTASTSSPSSSSGLAKPAGQGP